MPKRDARSGCLVASDRPPDEIAHIWIEFELVIKAEAAKAFGLDVPRSLQQLGYRFTKIMERRSCLLGLNSPVQVDAQLLIDGEQARQQPTTTERHPRRDRSHPWQNASGRSARHGSGRPAMSADSAQANRSLLSLLADDVVPQIRRSSWPTSNPVRDN